MSSRFGKWSPEVPLGWAVSVDWNPRQQGPYFTNGFDEIAYATWYMSGNVRARLRRWSHEHLRFLPKSLDARYMQQQRKNDELTARVRELERALRR